MGMLPGRIVFLELGGRIGVCKMWLCALRITGYSGRAGNAPWGYLAVVLSVIIYG